MRHPFPINFTTRIIIRTKKCSINRSISSNFFCQLLSSRTAITCRRSNNKMLAIKNYLNHPNRSPSPLLDQKLFIRKTCIQKEENSKQEKKSECFLSFHTTHYKLKIKFKKKCSDLLLFFKSELFTHPNISQPK